MSAWMFGKQINARRAKQQARESDGCRLATRLAPRFWRAEKRISNFTAQKKATRKSRSF
jgi:hypothetical protein